MPIGLGYRRCRRTLIHYDHRGPTLDLSGFWVLGFLDDVFALRSLQVLPKTTIVIPPECPLKHATVGGVAQRRGDQAPCFRDCSDDGGRTFTRRVPQVEQEIADESEVGQLIRRSTDFGGSRNLVADILYRFVVARGDDDLVSLETIIQLVEVDHCKRPSGDFVSGRHKRRVGIIEFAHNECAINYALRD